MIPISFIQDLVARSDVVQIVGRHVELKKAGINYKGLCPFHGEKTPSFIVSPTRQTYHCFGCGAHGDALRFLIEHTGAGFVEAVNDLAQQLGVPVPADNANPEDRARAQQQREHRATLSEVLARAADHYRKQLKTSPRAVEYLKGRGLSGPIAARFALGYAPEGWRPLASAYPHYDDPLLVDAGLVIVQGEDGADQKRYDRFRDRVMFPIRNVKGEVIGFGGRVLDSGEPKYLNSPETAVFVKGHELYGLYEARQALRERGYVLVTEGYMDVVALAQLGFENAVATLGTACTAEHVNKLLRFADNVVFSFDGDAAGRRAAVRALEAALPHATDTRSFRFLFLPPEHDPDSFVREHGSAAFEAQVQAAIPLSRQLLEHASQDCDLASAEGRARMLAQARPMLEQLPTGLLRQQLLADLAHRAHLPLDTLELHWATRSAATGNARRDTAARHDDPRLGRFRPRKTLPATGKRLERAARIAARHTDVWLQLGTQAHDVLAAQPAPYGDFFAAIDRIVQEHGPLPMAAMLHELAEVANAAENEAGAGPAVSHAFLQRLGELDDIGDEAEPVAQMEWVLHYLAEAAVDEELTLLLESGELSGAAGERRRELVDLQKRLKTHRPGSTA